MIALCRRIDDAVALATPPTVVTAEAITSVRMPSRSSSRERVRPSSSSIVALLSSKRTPLTMIEPKPVIGPLA